MHSAPHFAGGDRSERRPGAPRFAGTRPRGMARALTSGRVLGALLLVFAGWTAAGLTAAQAAAISSPYVVTIPETDPSQAVQEAMRVELVRLTGTRDAATDTSLAPIVDGARQYVQLERTTTSGRIQVLFDAVALRAAIEAAGRSIWDLNRPLLWVSLPAEAVATDQELRARLAASAEDRGLPILIAAPSAPAAGSVPAPSPRAAAMASPQAQSATELLESAHRAGANAALLARVMPSTPGVLQWMLAAPTTSGQWTGSPELAIENATETLASAARAIDQVPVAEYECHIAGVNDLAGFVNVLAALHAAPGITEFAVEDIEGAQLMLHVKAHASLEQLQRMLIGDRLQPSGTSAGGVLEYRYVTGP